MNNHTKRPNPKFTLEFKQDAVKLISEKGYTHQQAAYNLGISLSAIGRWSRAERGPANTSPTKTVTLNLVEHDELLRLRKENERLRMEREILKKAAGDSTGHCYSDEIFCDGDKKFNDFLGRSFNSSAILSSCCCE